LRKEINTKINEYPKSVLGNHTKLSINVDKNNPADVKCKDLL
jgi:hypothetical protein